MGKKISLILACFALFMVFSTAKAYPQASEEVRSFLANLEEAVNKMDTYSFIMDSENWKGNKHEMKITMFRFKKPNLMRTDVLEGDKKGNTVALRKDGKIVGRNAMGFKKQLKPTDERLKNIRGYTFMQSSLLDKIQRIKGYILDKGCNATLAEEEYMNKPAYHLHIYHNKTDGELTAEDIWFDKDSYVILKNMKFEGKDMVSDTAWRDHKANIPLEDSLFEP